MSESASSPSMGHVIELDHHESLERAIEGLKRRHRRVYEQLGAEYYGSLDGGAWGYDIEAACAEAAFAKFMSLYWRPSEGPQRPGERDVCGWEIRWTPRQDGHLFVYERDDDNAPYALVVGELPRYRIVGYIPGRDAKQPEYWREDCRKPCWWVPQSALESLDGTEGPWRGDRA